MRVRVLLSLMMALSGCTAVNYAGLPAQRAVGQIFMTAEGLSGPYESVGIVQVTRRGALAFGFADPAGTDLAAAVAEVEDQVRRAGADGLINTRIEQTSHTTAERIFGLIFFFAPIPSEVTVTGELVKVRPLQPGPAPGGPASGGPPL